MLTAAAMGCPGPGELQGGQAAEAEPDRRYLPAGARAGRAAPSSPAWARRTRNGRVVPQRHQAADDAVPVPGDAVAEHVAGQDDVAERGVAAGLLPGMLVEAGAAVDQQEAWSATGEVLGLAEESRQGCVQVGIPQIAARDISEGVSHGQKPYSLNSP